jgi:hypothetical protein
MHATTQLSLLGFLLALLLAAGPRLEAARSAGHNNGQGHNFSDYAVAW